MRARLRTKSRRTEREDDAGGVCVVERSPERITSVAMRVRRIYTGSKAHIQTRPVTSSKRERGSAAKPIFISYSYLPLERREQGLLHIHAPQMWIKWWWGCNNILGRSLEPVYGIDRPGAHTHKYSMKHDGPSRAQAHLISTRHVLVAGPPHRRTRGPPVARK